MYKSEIRIISTPITTEDLDILNSPVKVEQLWVAVNGKAKQMPCDGEYIYPITAELIEIRG